LQVRKGRLLQRSKKELRTSKLPPNQKIRIITILHQFRDKAARAVPDVGQLTRENCDAINELWERIKNIEVPSLVEQLETNHPFRAELDDGILRLLGIENAKQRTLLAAIFRRGAYVAIEALKQTMGAE